MAEAAARPGAMPGALRVRGWLLDQLQLDAVREAANVGACNAARALSELTGRRVAVEPPAVAVRPVAELLETLAGGPGRAAAVVDDVLGDLTGRVVFVMPQEAPDGTAAGFTRADELEPGLFRHAADLVIGSYIEHIGGMLGLVMAVVPGTPAVHGRAELAAGLAAALEAGNRFAFCVDSAFALGGSGARQRGHFLFLPDQESLPVIVGALFGGRPDQGG